MAINEPSGQLVSAQGGLPKVPNFGGPFGGPQTIPNFGGPFGGPQTIPKPVTITPPVIPPLAPSHSAFMNPDGTVRWEDLFSYFRVQIEQHGRRFGPGEWAAEAIKLGLPSDKAYAIENQITVVGQGNLPSWPQFATFGAAIDGTLQLPPSPLSGQPMPRLGPPPTPTAEQQLRQKLREAFGFEEVPLPHQFNPMIWGSLSQGQRDFLLSAAEAGLTPAGVISPDDYVRQLNAARPAGFAPEQVRTVFQRPNAVF